jgi:hypothetical protein
MISEVVIEKKKFVILPKERYEQLLKKQIKKEYDGQLLALEDARARTIERIEKWSKSK